MSYAYDPGRKTRKSGVNVRTEPSPYGEMLVSAYDAAESNPFRFSTKYADDESGLVYYGFRFYAPEAGRWTRRDPIGEAAFFLRYAYRKSRKETGVLREQSLMPSCLFVENNAVSKTDPHGLLVGVTPPGMPDYICGIAVWLENKGVEPPAGYAGPRDTYKHCYVGCLITRICGLTTTIIGGAAKEVIVDLIKKKLGYDMTDAEWRDFVNSLGGGTICAFKFWRSCKDCCRCYRGIDKPKE